MRRRRATDLAFLASAARPLGVCAALHVQSGRRRPARVGARVRRAPPTRSEYPRVRGFWPGALPDAAGGLASATGCSASATQICAASGRSASSRASMRRRRRARPAVPLVYAAGRRRDRGHDAARARRLPVAHAAAHARAGGHRALVLLRRGEHRIARAVLPARRSPSGLHWTFFFGGPRWQTYAWAVVFFCASLVMLPLILRAALIFPRRGRAAGSGCRAWPWLFAVFGPLSLELDLRRAVAPDASFRAALYRQRRLHRDAARGADAQLPPRRPDRAAPAQVGDARDVRRPVPLLLTDVVAAVDAAALVAARAGRDRRDRHPGLHPDRHRADQPLRHRPADHRRGGRTRCCPSCCSQRPCGGAAAGEPVSSASGVETQVVEPLLSVAVAAGVVPGARFLQPRIERVLFRERHAFRDQRRRAAARARDGGRRRRAVRSRVYAARCGDRAARVRDLRAARRRPRARRGRR